MSFNYQEVHDARHVHMGSGAVCEPEDVAYINAMVAKAEALWPDVAPYLELYMGGEWYAMYQDFLQLNREVNELFGPVWAFVEALGGWDQKVMHLAVPSDFKYGDVKPSQADYDLMDKYEAFILGCYKILSADQGVWAPEAIL